MRIIDASVISEAVKRMSIDSNLYINHDVETALRKAYKNEDSPHAKFMLDNIIENFQIAKKQEIPICQDTGSPVVFVEIGQNIKIEGDINEAINKGVIDGYDEGYLRKSIVKDPFIRTNTGDNSPAIIHYEINSSDQLVIHFMPKGGGSENCSKLFMLNPSEGIEGVKEKVVKTVIESGPNPCPPIIVGIGIGGNFEKCALLAKKALLRKIGTYNPAPHIKKLEKDLLKLINETKVGVQGLGGNNTALFVAAETYPCHIASLSLAINISCHATRHRTTVL